MPVPSKMSLQRFPAALKPHVRIAYATAWESLIETHIIQALAFVREFAPRVSPFRAFDLYFDVVPVLEPMVEPIRCRTLVDIDLDSLLPQSPPPRLAGWQRVRLDLHFQFLRDRRRFNERTLELARLAGAKASEELVATHVSNAVAFAALVGRVLSFEKAVEHYVREFSLSMATAQAVAQRAQAEVAARQLARQYEAVPEDMVFGSATPQPSVTGA